jgi:elongator complex protein 5
VLPAHSHPLHVSRQPKPEWFCAAPKFGETGILIIIDALTTLATLCNQSRADFNLPAYLSSLLVPPKESPQAQISLVAVNHVDVPLPPPSSPYSPTPLALVSYLATTIITIHSLPQVLAEKAARERSLPAPLYGLNEEVEGVVVGLHPKSQRLKREEQGIVIELEHRRKSGRGVHETYFLPKSTRAMPPNAQTFKESVILLEDHPLYTKRSSDRPVDDELAGLTFELGLTDRQKQDREGVVLPYFDAQQVGGVGEGGRILYDMGVEDDFDEEEDEI